MYELTKKQKMTTISLILGFSLLVISIIISKTAFHTGLPTCRHFIINTYLYLLASLILLSLFIMALDNTPELNPYHSRLLVGRGIASFIIMFIVIIFVLVVTMKIPSTNVLSKHLSWLLLVFLLSIVFYPSYYISRETNLFYSTLITVAAMMSILTIIAFWKPEWISLSWGPVLLVALIAAIILQLLLIATGSAWEKGGIAKWLAWGIVFLFSVFILYDTKRIQVLAKQCKGHPDYVNHSLAFLLDLINLFTNLLRGNLLD